MKYLYLALLLLAAAMSCNKDDTKIEKEDPIGQIENDTIANDTTTVIIAITDDEFAAENFGNTITADFLGKLIDSDGKPLEEVQITIGDQTVLTDTNGVFVLNKVSVSEKFAFVRAEKTDYIPGSRTIDPTSNGGNFINITLLKKNVVGTVDSGESSEVSLPNGAKVNFAGSFTDVSGAPYSGDVEGSMHYLEPNQSTTFSLMPGSLFGKRENNEATAMETYGMLAVNLYSPSGEVLNISKDTPAQIRFPISTTTPSSPSTIPLWYFDESVGYWKEQGKAIKDGDEFLAEVSHFTWWNCDLPLDVVNVCFELKNDVILPESYFEITRTQNNQLVYTGTTNSEGLHCGLFPKDEILTISIYNSCNDQSPISTESIGPYVADALNIKINITELSSDIAKTTLTADVRNCSDLVLTNGYALVYDKNTSIDFDFDIIPIVDGKIEQRFTYCRDNEYGIIVKDLDSNEVSDVIDFTAIENGITTLGQLRTCRDNENENVHEGSVTLQSQEEVDAFGLLEYTRIKGDLHITTDLFVYITSLASLTNLTTIEGDLIIQDYYKLTSLEGLNNLTSIGGNLEILYTSAVSRLNSLIGLENLTTIGGDLKINSKSNASSQITSLTGLKNLTKICVNLEINYHRDLTSLKGVEKLSSIGGNLQISGNHKLTSLTGLESVVSIGESLKISNNRELTSLIGLENLIRIDGNFEANNGQRSFEGLENLSSIGGNLEIQSQTKFTGLEKLSSIGKNLEVNYTQIQSFEGLENLTSIGENLEITGSLASLMGLENLSSIGGNLQLTGNDKLTSLTGLENLSSIGGNLHIIGNRHIHTIGVNNFSSIEGIDNLTTIGGNLKISGHRKLTSLTGIEKLFSVGSTVEIRYNIGLIDFCGLTTLFSNGTFGEVTVLNNRYNPAVQDIIDGNCKE